MLERSRQWLRHIGGLLALLGLAGLVLQLVRNDGSMGSGLDDAASPVVKALAFWPVFLVSGMLFNFIGNETRPMGAWLRVIHDLKLKSGDLYDAVAEKLHERKVPGHRCNTVKLLQRGWFSPRRSHLRVSRGEFRFDLYGAPFGTDFSVAWRSYAKTPIFERTARSIPFVWHLLEMLFFKHTPYYQDQGSLFQEAVHKAVRESIEEALSDQGLHALIESQFEPSLERELARLR